MIFHQDVCGLFNSNFHSTFGDIYDEDHFISTLNDHVWVVRRLPETVMERFGYNISNIPNLSCRMDGQKPQEMTFFILAGIRLPYGDPSSPTYSLVSSNPFGFFKALAGAGSSRMWTPGQSGTSSPVLGGGHADVHMSECLMAFRMSLHLEAAAMAIFQQMRW